MLHQDVEAGPELRKPDAVGRRELLVDHDGVHGVSDAVASLVERAPRGEVRGPGLRGIVPAISPSVVAWKDGARGPSSNRPSADDTPMPRTAWTKSPR